MPKVIPPAPNDDDRFFWDGVEAGELRIRACSACGRTQHPPTPMCPACGSVTWDARAVSGRGTVASWLVSKHPSRPDGESRLVALVELAEGHRLVSNLCDIEAADVRNGMPVEVCFRDVGGVRLPQFRPVPEVR